MTDHLLEAALAALCTDHGEKVDRYDVARAVGYIRDRLAAQRDPLDETNHADRYDCDGTRWWWCDACCGFRAAVHTVHGRGYSWPAAEIDYAYGPMTFAPRPAEPPTTAQQPAQAHGDADEPARPELNVQTALADAWAEGHRAGFADGVRPDDHITPNPYRKGRA